MDSSLSILSLLLEKAINVRGDSGGSVEGRIDLDSLLPEVNEHPSQWGKEIPHPWVYLFGRHYVLELPLSDDLSLVEEYQAVQ